MPPDSFRPSSMLIGSPRVDFNPMCGVMDLMQKLERCGCSYRWMCHNLDTSHVQERKVAATHVLLVEDDDDLRSVLQEVLAQSRYHVTACAKAMHARSELQKGSFDVAIMDIRLPDGNGIDLLRELRRTNKNTAAIMMTAYAEVDAAVDAMRLGADDFIKKPFNIDEMLVRIEEVQSKRQLIRNNENLTRQLHAYQTRKVLIGESPAIQKVREMIALLGDSDSTVLITGESGTGKEVVARQLHMLGSRANKPFVSINCGAIPEDLLESELFGHVKGAFTGAMRTRPGRFEVANGGTIFLDEIGDMTPKLQVKLLRVLQERCFEPVGSEKTIEVDVRVISATHRDLEKEIKEGRFREDLFYRLNVIPIHLPPLRERGEDVLLIAEHFIEHFNAEKNARIQGISEPAKQAMLSYPWPGNVRELQNVIERISVLKREGVVELQDLPSRMLNPCQRVRQNLQVDIQQMEQVDLEGMVEEFENNLILAALEQFSWNKSRAAKFLSLNRTTLVEKIKRKGLKPRSAG